jgi:hypothetical protein
MQADGVVGEQGKWIDMGDLIYVELTLVSSASAAFLGDSYSDVSKPAKFGPSSGRSEWSSRGTRADPLGLRFHVTSS